jgi:hypothetical protein
MNITKHLTWSERADAGLCDTLHGEREQIAADVNAGRLELFEVNGGEMWLVTCVAAGELVICCVQGRGLKQLADVLVSVARRQGLTRIRWFTRRPALRRHLRPLEVKLAGYVYHVDLQAMH